MRISIKLLIPFIFFLLIVPLAKNVSAATITLGEPVSELSRIVMVTFSDLTPGTSYDVEADGDFQNVNFTGTSSSIAMYACHFEDTGLSITKTVVPGCSADYSYYVAGNNHKIDLKADLRPGESGGYEVVASKSFTVSAFKPTSTLSPSSGFKTGNGVTVNVSGSREPKGLAKRNNYQILIFGESGTPRPGGSGEGNGNTRCFEVLNDGTNNTTFDALPAGNYRIEVKEQVHESDCDGGILYRTIRFTVRDDGSGEITSDIGSGGSGAGANPCSATECETALGNIPISVKGLAEKILEIALGVAGGIALILIVVGSIRVLISQGDQQKLNGGREMIIAAVAGLIFLIFSTLILKFIGINILKDIPGI